jgi:hypothetical protein
LTQDNVETEKSYFSVILVPSASGIPSNVLPARVVWRVEGALHDSEGIIGEDEGQMFSQFKIVYTPEILDLTALQNVLRATAPGYSRPERKL